MFQRLIQLGAVMAESIEYNCLVMFGKIRWNISLLKQLL